MPQTISTLKGAIAGAILLGGLASATGAQAGLPGGLWTRNSTVDSTVTDNGNGTWTYGYRVNNTSQITPAGVDPEPFIVDWELPWFGDAGITNIVSPPGWNHNIETIGVANPDTGWGGAADWQNPGDPFYAGPASPFTTATQVLHWYSECWVQQQPTLTFAAAAVAVCEAPLQDAIAPGASLGGFGFDSIYADTNSPYQASWAFLPVRTGDPAFPLGAGIPNSPAVQGIPEPALPALIGAGLLAWVAARRIARYRAS